MAWKDTLEEIQNIDLSDIERIGVWPIVVRSALWVAAFIVLIAAAYFVFVKDMNMQLQSAENKEKQLRTTFEQKAFEASNLDDYRKQMVAMEEAFEGLVSQLPSDTEVPGLLEDIEERGEATGLNLNSTTFQAERAAEFYVELPIEVKVQGTYHDLGSFVSAIAGMPRIVTLHDFTIGQSTSGRGLDMTILAKTYRYKGQEE
ncbi:type IV pilus inner membrane component PilO [Aurantivibrio plasticivorans]